MPFIVFIRNSSEPFMDFSLLLDSKPHEGRDSICSWYTLRAYWIFVTECRTEGVNRSFVPFSSFGENAQPLRFAGSLWDVLCTVLFPTASPWHMWFFPPGTFVPFPTDSHLCLSVFCSASSSAHVDQPSIWLTYFFFSHLDAVSLVTGSSECPGTPLVFLG